MEREIKFRAYINKSKEIKEISQINYATKTIVTTDGYCYGFKDIILMQYTGLKDKNGKEIYKGDIVYVLCEDENAIILWLNENAKFILEFDDWFSDFDCYYGKDLEVIGNIYDNKNLLEKGG